MLAIIYTILIFGVLIFVHELGHFLFARKKTDSGESVQTGKTGVLPVEFVIVPFDRVKAFRADDVLDAAGVFRGGLFAHAQTDQHTRDDFMPFVYGLGDRPALVGQGDMPIGPHDDISVFTEVFHGDADTGLAESQFGGNVDGADIRLFLA